jgi:hypothetical protein
MAEQQIPFDYEGIWKMVRKVIREVRASYRESGREFDRKMDQMREEFAEQHKKTELAVERANLSVAKLGDRIGEIVEHMIGGGIVEQFQALDIAIHSHSRDKTFGKRGTEGSGQIDVFLENGDLVVLVEVKTKPTVDEVREHIERLEKYRLYGNDKRRILGAVAGAVVSDNVITFSHRQGLFVIVQSGEAVEIVTPPKGFKAKEW